MEISNNKAPFFTIVKFVGHFSVKISLSFSMKIFAIFFFLQNFFFVLPIFRNFSSNLFFRNFFSLKKLEYFFYENIFFAIFFFVKFANTENIIWAALFFFLSLPISPLPLFCTEISVKYCCSTHYYIPLKNHYLFVFFTWKQFKKDFAIKKQKIKAPNLESLSSVHYRKWQTRTVCERIYYDYYYFLC